MAGEACLHRGLRPDSDFRLALEDHFVVGAARHRQVHHQARGLDAGQRLHRIEHAGAHLPLLGHFGIARRRQIDHGGRHAPWIETQTHRLQVCEAAQQERRSSEEQQRHRQLADDERGTEAAARRSARGPAGVVQGRLQVDARALQRRQDAEGDPGEQRHAEGEREDARVDVNRRADWPCGRAARDQRWHSPGGKQRSHGAAQERQENAFGDELAHDASAVRAQSGANGQLRPPGDGAGQQQIREVGASDEQHERDRAEQQQQRGAHLAGDALLQSNQVEGGVRLGIRVELPHAACEPVQLGLRRRARRPVAKPRHDGHEPGVSHRHAFRVSDLHRDPQAGFVGR